MYNHGVLSVGRPVTWLTKQSGHRIIPSLLVSMCIVSLYSLISYFIDGLQADSKNITQHSLILFSNPVQSSISYSFFGRKIFDMGNNSDLNLLQNGFMLESQYYFNNDV